MKDKIKDNKCVCGEAPYCEKCLSETQPKTSNNKIGSFAASFNELEYRKGLFIRDACSIIPQSKSKMRKKLKEIIDLTLSQRGRELKPYLQHLQDCDFMWEASDEECSCGLNDILDLIK